MRADTRADTRFDPSTRRQARGRGPWATLRWLRRGMTLAALVLAAGTVWSGVARAEYRAYELEVVDLYDCKINKRSPCKTERVTTSLSPDTYVQTHGGQWRIGAMLLATWMCYGDTAFFRPVCPRPAPRDPKFKVGEEVVVTLAKHITEGWRGKVEVAYYQASVRSNVYGVRFPEQKNVYARYYGKDLRKAKQPAPQTAPSQ